MQLLKKNNMLELTENEARVLLKNPLINLSEVARQFYPNKIKGQEQALRRRLSTKPMTAATLEKLTIIFAQLHADINAGDVSKQIL